MELKFDKVTKKYGDKAALKEFSATFTEGIYGILGPNGAGKSTLLGLITDNVRRDEGMILYNGMEIKKLGAEYRALLGYMPQVQGMYDEFSAREFLLYMAGIKGINKKDAKEQVESLLFMLGLAKEAHRKVGGFSGGMRQRVLLGQALLGEPKLLILDEPTAGLDPEERIRIRNYISKLAKDRIVMIATHIVGDIECIASEVLLLKRGELIRQDTPKQLIESIRGKVAEYPCTYEEVEQISNEYTIGNVAHRGRGLMLRIIGDTLHEQFVPVIGYETLEDVYLYYLEDKKV